MAAQTIRWAGMRLTVEGAAEFQQKLKDVNNQLKISQGELNKVTNAFDKNEQNAMTLAAQHQHLSESLRLNQEKQKALNMTLDDAISRYGENSSEVLGLKASLAEAEAEQVRLERALRDTERAIQGQSWTELGEKLEYAGERMQAVGDKMQSVGRGLTLGVTAPILAIGAAAIAVGADFDSSMRTIQARTGMTAEQAAELSSAFREMALGSNFTAREIAGSFAYIAVAGQDVEHSTATMRYAMVLANAVGLDLGATAYFLGNYLLKVGKDASYAEKYINVFAKTNQRTGIGLQTLQDYLFRANASLNAANISGTEATAVFGKLYQAGVRGANAYSGFQQAIETMLLPTEKQADAFARLGINTQDLAWQQKSTMDQFFALGDAMGYVTDGTERLDLMSTLFTQGSARAFADELFNQRDALRSAIPALYEAALATDGTGKAFEMAAIQQGGFAASGQQVRASLEEVSLQVADNLMPHALRLIETVGVWVNRFANLDESTQRNIIRFAAFAAAVGPVLTVGGKVVKTTGKMTAGFGKLSTAVGAAGGAKAYFALKFPLLSKGMAALTVKTGALGAGFVALKSKMLITSGKAKAFAVTQKAAGASSGILTKGLIAVKVAFAKLTAVMLANPIGLIIAGVAALGAGIAYLIIRARRVSEEYELMAEETARLVERKNELADAAANAAMQFQQNIKQMQDQAEHYRGLADSIAYLTGKQELSAGEMALLERHIAELNNSIPGLTLAYDAQTGALNMTVEALQAYLRTAEKRANIDAQLEEELRLRQEAIELEREHMAVIEKRDALEEQLNNGINRRRADHRALEQAIQDLTEAEAGYKAALEANANMQEAITQSIDAYSQALRALEQAQHEATESVDDLSEAMGRQMHTIEEWEQAQSDAVSKMNRSFENYQRIASNAFRTVSEDAAISVQELTANLQENARAVEEWSKNIAILTERGVDQGLIQQLRDAGPAAAATVRELVHASDEELEALNTAFEDSTRVAMESMKRELDPAGVVQSAGELIDKVATSILNNASMEDALLAQINTAFASMDDVITNIGFDGLGEDTVEGYVRGIENRLPDVRDIGQNTGETYSDALKSSLEQNSPSRVTERIGVGTVDGKIKGVRDNLHRIDDIGRTLARTFINGVANKITQNHDIDNATRRQIEDMRQVAVMAVMNANFDSVGFDMSSGVARGIQNGGGIVSNAARNMINNALNAMRTAAQTFSPSRRSMKIADDIGDGLIIRMIAKGKELAEVCKKITDKVFDNLYIDPSELISNAHDVLHSMQTALPALESNIRYTTGSQPAPATMPTQHRSYTINFNNPVVRDDKDIYKLAKMVKKMIGDDVDIETRIGGIALQS